MLHTQRYSSPLGGILLAADDAGLTGLWFEGQKYFAAQLDVHADAASTPVLDAAWRWLDMYFEGRKPDFTPPLHLSGTPFRLAVWKLLLKIPYGATVTYGALAKQLAAQAGKKAFSAQAVGGAVGHNPVSVIVPCHRVVGAGGSLTGYAGGVARKYRLLALENADMSGLYVPEKGTAL